eukprot:2416199-Amphidinium_carterae.2
MREDADIWVEGVMNGSKFHMSYRRTDDPHEFSSSWTGFTYVKQESQGEIPIVPGGDAFAMVDSGASHMLLPLKSLQTADKEKANKISVKLAVGNRTAFMFRDKVFAEGRVQHLIPLCRVSEKLELSLVLSDGVGQLRCTNDDGENTSHLMTFTRFQGLEELTLALHGGDRWSMDLTPTSLEEHIQGMLAQLPVETFQMFDMLMQEVASESHRQNPDQCFSVHTLEGQ